MKRRHWHHCTSEDLGKSFEVLRKAPVMIGFKEPLVPRLCVCQHVYQCFAARLFSLHRPVRVYRTEFPRRANKPHGVWDAFLTGEHWLVPPARMILVETIDTEAVEAIHGTMTAYHEITRKHSNHKLKIAQLLIAAKYFDEGEYRRYSRLKEYLDGKDPERYIYSEINRELGADEAQSDAGGVGDATRQV